MSSKYSLKPNGRNKKKSERVGKVKKVKEVAKAIKSAVEMIDSKHSFNPFPVWTKIIPRDLLMDKGHTINQELVSRGLIKDYSDKFDKEERPEYHRISISLDDLKQIYGDYDSKLKDALDWDLQDIPDERKDYYTECFTRDYAEDSYLPYKCDELGQVLSSYSYYMTADCNAKEIIAVAKLDEHSMEELANLVNFTLNLKLINNIEKSVIYPD